MPIETVLFELQSAQQSARPDRKKNPPAVVVRSGSVSVNIYGRGPDGRIKGPFTIAWRESANGARKRVMRSDMANAKKFAGEKAVELANGETVMLSFTPEDKASYRRALDLLNGTGKTLEVAVSEYADCLKRLNGRQIYEAVKFFLDNAAADFTPKLCGDIVQDLLREKKADKQISFRWLKTLEDQLAPFSKFFQCPLAELRAPKINLWLRSRPGNLRTRKNNRGAISVLVTHARENGFLPKAWRELDDVPIPDVDKPTRKPITPEQLVSLLAIAPEKAVPFIVLGAFAGIRHMEMCVPKGKEPLDWRDFDWENKVITIGGETAKNHGDERLIKMSDNLIAWLQPYRRRSGPVCLIANASSMLTRCKREAGIPGGKNETRNCLRKSWFTYSAALGRDLKLIVEEGGNSKNVAKRNYIASRLESEALRWFAIRPDHADILQLPLNFAIK